MSSRDEGPAWPKPSPSQDGFVKALLDPHRPAPEGLVGKAGEPAGKRFDVYRNNVAVSLTDALETAFPAIRSLVGEAFFRAMAGVYLRQHPPRSPLMMFYGAAMPAFLEAFEPAAKLPYLPDVARLELALRAAYHAADAPAILPDALQAVAPDALAGLRLGFVPAMQLIRSAYPLHAIYRTATQPNAPKPAKTAQAVLVTRPAYDPILDPLNAPAARFIAALAEGAALGPAADAAGDGLDLGAVLGLLLSRCAIKNVQIN
ncbi:MAG: DNA-binding domain-containing protein [Pseudomonadota bacterium]